MFLQFAYRIYRCSVKKTTTNKAINTKYHKYGFYILKLGTEAGDTGQDRERDICFIWDNCPFLWWLGRYRFYRTKYRNTKNKWIPDVWVLRIGNAWTCWGSRYRPGGLWRLSPLLGYLGWRKGKNDNLHPSWGTGGNLQTHQDHLTVPQIWPPPSHKPSIILKRLK